MQIDGFLKLVRERRSMRRFKTDAVPRECIENIVEAARWAMSGANAQPWEFVAVTDAPLRRRIIDASLEARREVYAMERERLPELRHSHYHHAPMSPNFEDAPVLIVVLGDRRTYQATVLAAHYLNGEGGTDATYLKNIANATQNMHLAAAATGLGSQWISVSYIWGQAIKGILNIPEVLDVHTIVAVGYPAYQPPTPYRRQLKDILHYNAYDKSKYRSGEDVQQFLHTLRQRTEAAYKQG